MDPSRDAPNTSCPSPTVLRAWLDGLKELEQFQIEHVRQCEHCCQTLDEFSDAPELRLRIDQRKTLRFEGEQEYRALKGRIVKMLAESQPASHASAKDRR